MLRPTRTAFFSEHFQIDHLLNDAGKSELSEKLNSTVRQGFLPADFQFGDENAKELTNEVDDRPCTAVVRYQLDDDDIERIHIDLENSEEPPQAQVHASKNVGTAATER